MESFDRRHFTAALWDLDAVTDEDKAPIDAQGLREQAQHHLGPYRRELIELHGSAMEVTDEGVVLISP